MLHSLRDFFSLQGNQARYWVAYSGGLDSHVLLSLVHQLQKEYSLRIHVIHIHHGLSPYADEWVLHCQQICKKYDLGLVVEYLKLPQKQKKSLEAMAREKRYACFAKYIEAGDILLTAHHQDDQAETLLLQLFRGSGLAGLAAMPKIKKFHQGWHARPLLACSREELNAYALEHDLKWIEDESNRNCIFTRNFLRYDLLSILKKRWRNIAATITRTAAHLAEANSLLEEYASQLREQSKGILPNTLSLTQLRQFTPAQQRLILRSWIQHQGYRLPNTKKLLDLQHVMLHAAIDRYPVVSWDQISLKRYRDQLFLIPNVPLFFPDFVALWDFSKPLIIPAWGSLIPNLKQGFGLSMRLKKVEVLFRAEHHVQMASNRPRQLLKKLFQEWGIPPWERGCVPLIFWEGKCVAAVGYFIDPLVRANEKEWGWDISKELHRPSF